MSRGPDVAAIQRTLKSLIASLPDDGVTVDPEDTGPDSIRRLGLSSGQLLAFLVSVEDAFGLAWDDDLDPAILASFETMAAHLAERLSARVAR